MIPNKRDFLAILIAGALVIVVACSDSVIPTQPSAERAVSTLVTLGGPGSSSIRGNRREEADAKPVSFDIKPKGGRVRAGAFELVYSDNAVCDPATSGYGPDVWKTPCQALTKPIRITGKVWVQDGMTFTDFSPDIRFNPASDVYLTVKINDIQHLRPQADWADTYGIWYTTRVGDVRYLINDAADNPELTTVFETDRKGNATGWVTRKIWHFSGYFVRSGRTDEGEGSDSAY